MKQITEDYCSFEIAKLLKEKGFDESCAQIYDGEGCLLANDCGYINDESPNEYFHALAPTHQMAFKWLREIHGFIVTIDYDRYPIDNGENNIVGYGYNIQTKDNPEDYYRIIESVYDCYEQAVEAALLYVLKNLI